MTVLPPASDGMFLTPVVSADGSELSDAFVDALEDVRIRRALRTIGRCTLRFADPGFTLADKGTFKVGVKVAVRARSIASGSSQVSIFEGKVTSIEIEQRGSGQPELVVLAEDLAYELSRASRAATYLDQTASDIITTLVTGVGATASVAATSATLEYTLQTDSDLGFIDELCRRNGFDWEVDGTTFQAWKSPAVGGAALGSPVTFAIGDTLHSFSAKVHADAPRSVTVRGWDHLNKKEVVATSTPSRSHVPTRLATLAPTGGVARATTLDSSANPVDATDAHTLAAVDAAATGTVLARGQGTIAPTLRPGVSVTIEHAGPASGSYYVREVEHVYRSTGFHTAFVAGDRDQPTVLGDGLRIGAQSPARHPGLVVGVVSAIENDPDAAGRVKVSLPGLDSTIESQWARLAVPGGGKDRGIAFVPEVNDEVLVGFEGGDTRRPVVIGGLFGKKDTIPTGLVDNGEVTHRRLTSRLGHVIEMGDGTRPADQHLRLTLTGGAISLRLGKDRADLTLPAGVPLKIAVGRSSIELDGEGAISLAGTTITLKAEQSVTIEGAEVTAKASAKFAASGAQAELKSDGTTTVQSSGITAVKGSMVQIN